MDVLFLMSLFRLYPRLKLSFEHKTVRKNLVLRAWFCWDSRLSIREMHQNFLFGGNLGYGHSYLEFLFRHLKAFRLHAILHDAAGAVEAQSGQGSGYCYLIGREPIHVRLVTWLDYSFASTLISLISFCPPLSTPSAFEAVCLALY